MSSNARQTLSATESGDGHARQTAPFPNWSSGCGCRTLVVFKGAGFLIINSIVPRIDSNLAHINPRLHKNREECDILPADSPTRSSHYPVREK